MMTDHLEFWQRTLAGERLPVLEGKPQPGFYTRRLVKSGPRLSVEIRQVDHLDDHGEPICDPTIECFLEGEEVDATRVWPTCAKEPISEEDYHHQIADRDWLNKYDADGPETNPYEPIDLRQLDPIF